MTAKRYPVGATIFGGLGLVLLLTSLGSPWTRTTSTTGDGDSTFVDGTLLNFGVGTVLYVGGVAAVLVLGVGTLASRGNVRLALGLNGLVGTLVPTAGLVLIADHIRDDNIAAMRKAAKLADSVNLIHGLQAGPLLAGLAVFALALAIARYTWPQRPTACYFGGAIMAAVLVLAIPWAAREAYFDDRVALRDYWFFSLGPLGFLTALGVLVLIVLAVIGASLAGRAWWPAALAPAVVIAYAVPPVLLEGMELPPDRTVAGAEDVTEVINNLLPIIWAFVCLVTCICALVMSVRERGWARRNAVQTATVPAL